MPDYVLRSQVLNTDLVKNIKYLNSMVFYNPDSSEIFTEQLLKLQEENIEYFREACRIMKSDYDRNTRLKKRIQKLMKLGPCVFLTLTFRDEVLESTSPETRRTYVARFLKTCSKHYVGNVDYGSTTGREHYHAIVVGRVDMDKWKYGFVYAKSIIQSSNPLILAKYISKLANHAVKETCKRSHLIYSREDADRFT